VSQKPKSGLQAGAKSISASRMAVQFVMQLIIVFIMLLSCVILSAAKDLAPRLKPKQAAKHMAACDKYLFEIVIPQLM
jgi:hypothetical protein